MTKKRVGRIQRVIDQQEGLARKYHNPIVPKVFGDKWYWVWGVTKKGKQVLWGPYHAEVEAERELAALEDGEVFGLDTRDVARATREVKAILLERGTDPDEALSRLGHKRE